MNLQSFIAFLIVLLVISCCTMHFVECNPVIQTKSGPVQGVSITTSTGKMVDAFLGIPFAEPPTGSNRFLPPKIKKQWKDVFVADRLPNSCYQYVTQLFKDTIGWCISRLPMSEDCLYLNIWVPNPRPDGKTAVMAWIHGGGFLMGSSNVPLYDGAILASEENVVVVSFNYRLNVLGFLNLDETTRNIGFLDQVAALKWIQENIDNFGGDPRKVAIFGESAGAMSVEMHMNNPRSKNLFRSAIIESGPPNIINKIISQDSLPNYRKDYLRHFNCFKDKNTNATLNCLRQIKPEDLISELPNYNPFLFTPLILNDYMKKPLHKVNILIGTTLDDGSTFAAMLNGDTLQVKEDSFPTHADAMQMFTRLFPIKKDFVYKTIDFFYTDWLRPNATDASRREMVDVASDYLMKCETADLANRMFQDGNDVYRYQFSHVSSVSKYPKWMGSLHGEEIQFVFGRPLEIKYDFKEEETAFSSKVMHFWANFAKYGNPNGPKEQRTIDVWPLFTPESKEYIDLSINMSTKMGIRDRECAFWSHYFPEIQRLAQ